MDLMPSPWDCSGVSSPRNAACATRTLNHDLVAIANIPRIMGKTDIGLPPEIPLPPRGR